ncbi:heme exporter protein CcmD [uncultured Brevundimonas sp.]|uniref:heme exporter protein CcmD n=1 Tax=uncultured Brevundimonas sp. TaxID=213418 RepID=UPI0026121A3A|nr:heme exporter protein CcmD [uncultured Brevundimonas sp.]
MPDLDMSPYAAFVWPAWGVSALVLAALTVRALIASRKWKRELDRLETDASPEETDTPRPQAARSAVGQQGSPQAAQRAVGPEE